MNGMNNNKQTAKPVSVTCDTCEIEFALDTRSLQEREQKLLGERFTEVGIECPGCGAWTHAYFKTKRTRSTQAAWNRAILLFQKRRTEGLLKKVYAAEQRHKTMFDSEQIRLRTLLGKSSPTAVLGQAVDDIDKLAL